MEKILEIKNLKKYFPLGKSFFGNRKILKAVDNVSLDLYRGETLGIIGESGCGKSTLGRCIVNLYNINSGSVNYFEKDLELKLTTASESEKINYSKLVQIIFQDPFASLNPRINIFETIAEPLIIHNFNKKDIERKVTEIISHVGLRYEHLRRYPHSFSGGQRQRIGIARALIISPKVVVCDEAVSALDVSVQAQIINLLKELQKKYHYSYIFISHDMSVIRHICDRIAVMYAGNIIEIGPKNDILYNPKHPYTEALLDAVPRISKKGTKSNRRILEGEPPDLAKENIGCLLYPRCRYSERRCQSISMELLKHDNTNHFSGCIRTKEINLSGL